MTDIPSGQLFYAGSIEGELIRFDTFESRHLFKVLRKREGDEIYITDGRGNLCRSRIVAANANRLTARVVETRHFDPPPRRLHVYIAPPKSIDRFEWFLEKAVELGVWEITPVHTDFGERSKLNFERLEKIIISALKQSMRLYKPRLHPWKKWDEVLDESNPLFAALCKSEKPANDLYVQSPSASVLIGPEGGFSPAERKRLEAAHIHAIRLGRNRLRTETAGVAAVCLYYGNA